MSSKRFTVIRGCCHIQKVEVKEGICSYCGKKIPNEEWAIKGRINYIHLKCFLDKVPELKKRVEAQMERVMLEQL